MIKLTTGFKSSSVTILLQLTNFLQIKRLCYWGRPNEKRIRKKTFMIIIETISINQGLKINK